jgi:nucleotidyltransferase substrate binding protein (TIGR01987 family)
MQTPQTDLKQQRFNQRKANYIKSLSLLITQSKKDNNTDENIAATLHFYEIAFELSWKMLKDFLEIEGVIVRSPREAIKTAFHMEYIKNGHIWLEMLEARNRISHTYEESMAIELFTDIKSRFLPELVKLESL